MKPAWLPSTLLVATHNPGKLEEWRRLLSPLDIEVLDPEALGLQAPEETESTYLGNARLKALAAHRSGGLPALADDTGFESDALGGQPGVRTARWAAAHGGYPAALHALAAQAGPGTAGRLVCAVAIATERGSVREAEASIEGRLRSMPMNAPGFAGLLEAEGLWTGGVLAHRRRAFAALTSR